MWEIPFNSAALQHCECLYSVVQDCKSCTTGGGVTGGIHGGNRLGGNALTEILVSGRIAATSLMSH